MVAAAKRKKAAETPPAKRIKNFDATSIEIPLENIERCRWQPRQEFPADELAALGEQLATQGQLVPIIVRPSANGPGIYELIDGERRYRAAKSAGLATLRAEVIEATDAEVRQMVLATALYRKQLNAIEEAAAFHQAIENGDAAGPTELARQLGLSQGHVSNRLRLLELPREFQEKVISCEIPPSHARSVVRYKDHPAILQAISERVAEALENEEGLGSVDDWDAEVKRCAWNATEPLGGTRHSDAYGRSMPVFTPTTAQRKELGIIKVKSPWAGEEEERATNLDLWNDLQAAHEAEHAGRAAKDSDLPADRAETAGDRGEGESPEDDAAKQRERLKKFRRGAWDIAIAWRRRLIAQACRDEQVSPEDASRLLLLFAASAQVLREGGYRANCEIGRREDILALLLDAKTKDGRPVLWNAIAGLDDRDVVDSVVAYVAAMFHHPTKSEGVFEASLSDADVIAIADHLKIDLAAAWKEGAAGDLTEEWLELHMKEDLLKLAAKAGIKTEATTKSDLVKYLLSKKKELPVPAELLKPKRPKD